MENYSYTLGLISSNQIAAETEVDHQSRNVNLNLINVPLVTQLLFPNTMDSDGLSQRLSTFFKLKKSLIQHGVLVSHLDLINSYKKLAFSPKKNMLKPRYKSYLSPIIKL